MKTKQAPADLLKKWRHRNNLTQEEVARAAMLSVSTLQSWEQGKASPNLTSLLPLRTAFDDFPL